MLITSTSLSDTWAPVTAEAGIEHVITFESASGQTTGFNELLEEPATHVQVPIDPTDIVTLPYSSGTTGLPKGVMLTHRNLVANILQVDATNHYLHDRDTTIAFLPFFHIYGMVVIGLVGLWSGATLVIMPKFDLETYLQLVEHHRATLLHVVPPVVVALAKHPAVEHRDFSSIRKLFSGAAPLAASTIEQCARRINCVLQQGYGLTETSPATHVTSDEPSKNSCGSVGQLVSNTECRVVDPATGADVATGQDGEIWLRGPQVMRGYLNCPDATRATIDAEGWLHSGDIGHADSDGNFYVVDRLKELIKYKGMQVAPAELEALLLTHPAIADAAVVSLKDEEVGEIPRAFVVLKAPATADELIAFVAERVAAYKKIRRVDFIDAIPKSPSGKILRRLLRDVAVT
jgi:acyl-CoA synthetase (AMP-forming)/AMP-acid ligase II